MNQTLIVGPFYSMQSNVWLLRASARSSSRLLVGKGKENKKAHSHSFYFDGGATLTVHYDGNALGFLAEISCRNFFHSTIIPLQSTQGLIETLGSIVIFDEN